MPELGPQIHWSRDKPWAGALCFMGDHSEILVEVKTHNEKASTAQDSALAVRVKKGQCPDRGRVLATSTSSRGKTNAACRC